MCNSHCAPMQHPFTGCSQQARNIPHRWQPHAAYYNLIISRCLHHAQAARTSSGPPTPPAPVGYHAATPVPIRGPSSPWAALPPSGMAARSGPRGLRGGQQPPTQSVGLGLSDLIGAPLQRDSGTAQQQLMWQQQQTTGGLGLSVGTPITR
jgi:hypothetical protein